MRTVILSMAVQVQILLLTMVFTLFVTATGCTSSQAEPNFADPAPLVVKDDALHIGTQWSSPDFTLEIPVQNVSELPLTIKGFSSSCTCTTANLAGLRVEPRGTSKLQIHLNLNATPSSEGQPGKFRAMLTGEYTDGVKDYSFYWNLSGKVVANPIQVSPGHALINDFEDRSLLQFRVTSQIPLMDVVATLPDGMQMIARNAANEAQTEWEVLLDARSADVPCTAQIVFTAVPTQPINLTDANLKSPESLPSVKLPVTFTTDQRAVQITPRLVLFTSATPGRALTELLTFESSGNFTVTPNFDQVEECFALSLRHQDDHQCVYAVTLASDSEAVDHEIEFEIQEGKRFPYLVRIPVRAIAPNQVQAASNGQ